jgi:hypothetical protein
MEKEASLDLDPIRSSGIAGGNYYSGISSSTVLDQIGTLQVK